MIPGPNKDCMTILFSVFLTHQFRHQAPSNTKWAISLVIADGHFDLPQVFMWVACTVLLI